MISCRCMDRRVTCVFVFQRLALSSKYYPNNYIEPDIFFNYHAMTIHDELSREQRLLASAAAFAVFFLLVAYVVTLVLGFLSLQSPLDPIGDPYFSVLELLIVVMAPLMVLVMAAVHIYTPPSTRMYSLCALAFMTIMAAITAGVHFVILTVSRPLASAGFPWGIQFFSFVWPSVVYALDILAWDLFFGLSMLFASLVFLEGRLDRILAILMILSGVLSLAGLAGVYLSDMGIRNIGIMGYAGVSMPVFLLLGFLFRRAPQEEPHLDTGTPLKPR